MTTTHFDQIGNFQPIRSFAIANLGDYLDYKRKINIRRKYRELEALKTLWGKESRRLVKSALTNALRAHKLISARAVAFKKTRDAAATRA